jgi:hypothetical protein
MANESKEIFLPYIRKTILTSNREQLIDLSENLLDIVLANPKTKKELLSMVQINITLAQPEFVEEVKEVIKQAKGKKEKVVAEKPKKAHNKMSDLEMAKAIANELKDVDTRRA